MIKIVLTKLSFSYGLHRKKRFTSFPSPAGMSLTKLPLRRNNSVITSLFPPRESLVVTSRLGKVNYRTFFLRCRKSPSLDTLIFHRGVELQKANRPTALFRGIRRNSAVLNSEKFPGITWNYAKINWLPYKIPTSAVPKGTSVTPFLLPYYLNYYFFNRYS